MAQTLDEAARKLAVLGLQSKEYVNDPDFKDAVDAVLAIVLYVPVMERPRCTTMVHPGTEKIGARCVLVAGHDGKCQPECTLHSDIAEDR